MDGPLNIGTQVYTRYNSTLSKSIKLYGILEIS